MAAKSSKTSRYTETERKFDVVEATVAPSFEGLSAVAREITGTKWNGWRFFGLPTR